MGIFALSRPEADDLIVSPGCEARHRRDEIDGLPDLKLVKLVCHNRYTASVSTGSFCCDMSSSRSGFSAFFQSKKLKAAFANRLFDVVSRDFVRQVLIWRDGAHCMPGLELARQLNARQIATERAQVGIHLGFEDENPHRASTLAGDAVVVVNGIV
ncbi:MAG TPA: hypothetical protein VK653_03010 [Xanthobacteraceae bacterium]|nr:hypothetical protein [Xanthobacteraceae bacterium]